MSAIFVATTSTASTTPWTTTSTTSDYSTSEYNMFLRLIIYFVISYAMLLDSNSIVSK